MLMQISHNDFGGTDYIQVIQSGCVILEVPLERSKNMSILIKGAKMPENCEVCPVDEPMCNLWELMDETTEHRHPDCPLVEILPHGELIDRTTLLNCIVKIVGDRVSQGYITASELWRTIVDIIKEAPTVIESEEQEQ